MNKKEMAQILAVVRAVYPNTKIEDAGAMVTGWYMELGDYAASSVMKAARLHMSTSKYFPTPAEIKEKIVRAELIYSDSELDASKLESGQPKLIGNNTDIIILDDKLENLCKELGFGYQSDYDD